MRRFFLPAAIKASSTPTSQALVQFSPAAFRTSAAFFHSLTTNLHLAEAADYDYASPSPLNTPILRPCVYSMLQAIPSSLSHATSSSDLDPAPDNEAHTTAPAVDPLAGIPELTTFIAESEQDQVDGLKLVADSVAQQRQFASWALIYHPLNLAMLVLILSLVTNWMYQDRRDIARIFTTWAGIVMTYLLTIRFFTHPYTKLAEDINWDWLGSDRILVTRFGDQIIGALVLSWILGDAKGSRKKRKGRGLIRAWTVRLKYRHKGVGTGLLEEAVQAVNQEGGDGLDFAQEHANSMRVLKDFYNKPFDHAEISAQHALDEAVRQNGVWLRRSSR